MFKTLKSAVEAGGNPDVEITIAGRKGIHEDLIETTKGNANVEGRGSIGVGPGDSNNVVIDVLDDSNETTCFITQGKCLF